MTKARVAVVSDEDSIAESEPREQNEKLVADVSNTCAPRDKLHKALQCSSVGDHLGVQDRAEVEHHGETIKRQSIGSAPLQNFHMPVPKVFTKGQFVQ